MKKLIWLWKRFCGFQIRIKVDNRLKEDEALLYRHVLYLPPDYVKGGNDK